MSESKTPRTAQGTWQAISDNGRKCSVVNAGLCEAIEADLAAAHEREESLRADIRAALNLALDELYFAHRTNLGNLVCACCGVIISDSEEHAQKCLIAHMEKLAARYPNNPDALAAPSIQRSLWLPIESAPMDGTIVVGKYEDGECLICWSDNPICMLGPRCGSFPPGWATAGDETDNNLPMDPPEAWRPEESAPETIAQEGEP